MEKVIANIVTNSFADQSYGKAIKALKTYRSEAIDVSPMLDSFNISSMNRVSSMILLSLLRKGCLLAS